MTVVFTITNRYFSINQIQFHYLFQKFSLLWIFQCYQFYVSRGEDLAFLPVIGIPVIPYLPIRQSGVVQCEPLVSGEYYSISIFCHFMILIYGFEFEFFNTFIHFIRVARTIYLIVKLEDHWSLWNHTKFQLSTMLEKYQLQRKDCSGRTFMYKAIVKVPKTSIGQMTEVTFNLFLLFF